jgi:hypothetical protein
MKNLYDYLWFRVLIRFVRVFVLAGIGQVGIVLAATPLTNFDPDNIKQWLGLLVTSFVIGGLAALDKAIREL